MRKKAINTENLVNDLMDVQSNLITFKIEEINEIN